MTRVPTRRNPTVPDVFSGQIYENIGKYARGAVLYAFEEVGGPKGLADWARDNPDEFYTKLFPKIIARETEVHHHRSVDDIMDVLDGDYEVAEVVPIDAPQPNPYARAFEDDPADAVTPPSGDDWQMDYDIDDLVEFDD